MPVLQDLTGSVHSWDLSTGVDGPGARFVLFLAGCPLRCQYCQNPDTWHERTGRRSTVSAVVEQVAHYRPMFERTGGGLTISGGEPLLQPEFTEAVLRGCRDLGVSTALDTSGALGRRASDRLLDATDLVLLDIKSFDRTVYARVTGGGQIADTLEFASRLALRDQRVWIRFVVGPGLTDGADNVSRLAEFVGTLRNVERVDVIGFHKLGQAKYDALGLSYPVADVPEASAELLESVRARFSAFGLTVT
jgi:pyruvate formate lyase activating enzyme